MFANVQTFLPIPVTDGSLWAVICLRWPDPRRPDVAAARVVRRQTVPSGGMFLRPESAAVAADAAPDQSRNASRRARRRTRGAPRGGAGAAPATGDV